MKVAQFTGLRSLEIVDAPLPCLDRPDDVLLRIDRVGICGSDVHYYAEGRIGNQVLRYPSTIGHECAGTVVEVGPAVIDLAPGDRVAIDPAFSCHTCDQCRAGRAHTCRRLQFMGSPNEAPGAVAEFYVAPAGNCFAIPASMTLDEATLVEPLSIGLHAVRLGHVATGAKIGILGAGPIGLSVLLCAKAAGASACYITDLLDERLNVARRCGADWTGSGRGDVVADILKQEPLGLDLVFECSGDPACIGLGQRLLAPGGTLVLVGITAADQLSFDPHRMRRTEITFKAVRRQNECVAPVIQMIGQGQIDPSPLLTHHFRLDQIRDAFELVAAYRDGVVKAMLHLTDAR